MARAFTHEQTQALLEALRQYHLWVADAEYRADTKSPQIMEGLDTLRAAEDFIEELDAGVTERAALMAERWRRLAEE